MITDKNKNFLAKYGSENHIDRILDDQQSYKGDGSLGSIIYGSGTRVHSILYNPHITTKNLRKMIWKDYKAICSQIFIFLVWIA